MGILTESTTIMSNPWHLALDYGTITTVADRKLVV